MSKPKVFTYTLSQYAADKIIRDYAEQRVPGTVIYSHLERESNGETVVYVMWRSS